LQTTTALIADLHSGSSVSLCKPVTHLDDGGTYHASKAQKELFYDWEDLLDKIEHKRLDRLYTVANGDIAEGDYKNRSKQLITRNKSSIVAMTTDLITPLIDMSDGVFFVRGTMAHTGKSGELEELIAQNFDNTISNPDTEAKSWYWLPLKVEGVRMDISHETNGGGGRPFNRFSSIDRLASDTVFSYANDRKEDPPHLVIRGHIHQYKDSFSHFRTRAITLPAWTLATEYVNKIAPGALADIGAVLIHCSAGNYEVEAIKYEPRKRRYFTV